MQYAVNWMREVALSRNGAMPGLFNGFVGLMRTSVATLIEAGQEVPVMFGNRRLLLQWARKKGFSPRQVGALPSREVLCLCPTTIPKQQLNAVELYWVKASSHHYRTALIEWCQMTYGPDHVQRAHEESITFFRALQHELTKLAANHVVFGRSGQTAVLASVKSSLTAHLNAYSSGGNPKIAYQLLAVLDADHVLNRASLKQIPDAWVMLFPVPADANRGFGRTVERFRPSVKPGTRTIPLTPETTFKLFCGAMPRNRSELQKLKTTLAGQLRASNYVASMCAAVERRLPPP
jgi:hypothetical protein